MAEPEKPSEEGKKVSQKMTAPDYIARALADPGFGDSRRDELALAALKYARGSRVRDVTEQQSHSTTE